MIAPTSTAEGVAQQIVRRVRAIRILSGRHKFSGILQRRVFQDTDDPHDCSADCFCRRFGALWCCCEGDEPDQHDPQGIVRIRCRPTAACNHALTRRNTVVVLFARVVNPAQTSLSDPHDTK